MATEKLVRAGDLEGGEWFRKRTGEHRHLVVSESAARYHKLPEGKVYGVSLETGNMSAVDPETIVVQIDPFQREPPNPWSVHYKADGERCPGGPACRCAIDGWSTQSARAAKTKPTRSPSSPPPAAGPQFMLGCGICEHCMEGDDCLHAGEPLDAMSDEDLSERF